MLYLYSISESLKRCSATIIIILILLVRTLSLGSAKQLPQLVCGGAGTNPGHSYSQTHVHSGVMQCSTETLLEFFLILSDGGVFSKSVVVKVQCLSQQYQSCQGTYQKYKCSGSIPDLQHPELEGWSPLM